MSDMVLTEQRDTVSIVTLNNPGQRNALTIEMRAELTRVLSREAESNTSRTIVITGAEGAFCSGSSIKGAPPSNAEPASVRTPRLLRMLQESISVIVDSPKPVIAAVEGHAFGAGLSLATACDYIIASPTAKFCASFPKIGLIPDAGLLWSLPRRIGQARAHAMMISACTVEASEAWRIGLVDKLETEQPVLQAALEFAAKFDALAPLPTAHLRALSASGPLTLAQAFAAELDIQPKMTASADYLEARAAFTEKRAPRFMGK